MTHDDPVINALGHGVKIGFLPAAPDAARILGVNFTAPNIDFLCPVVGTDMVQYWAGPMRDLRAHGYDVHGAMPDDPDCVFDRVLVHAPKQMDEMQYLLAAAWRVLKPGGDLIAAAANDAGGARLMPSLQDAGVDFTDLSKSKCRVVRAVKPGTDMPALMRGWLDHGVLRRHDDTGFVTCPGLFCWNRVDAGSDLLRAHLPLDLSGVGADFGCGYGFLSHYVLNNFPGVTRLYGLDADYRAVLSATQNMAANATGMGARFVPRHVDIPAGSGVRDLDFIVMNPPFHTGAREHHDLGRAFIMQAHAALRKNGVLWVVANTHLGYEADLKSLFPAVNRVYEDRGYKIYKAVA